MLFTAENTWIGGYFELALEVSEQRNDDKLFTAFEALWRYPFVEGVYMDRDIEPSDQPLLPVLREYIAGYGTPLYGIAHIGNASLACRSSFVRHDDGSDWLDFLIPVGALAPLFPLGGFPFGTGEPQLEASLTTIDEWLIQMGQAIYSASPYALGLVGFDVSGNANARGVQAKGIPVERYMTYLWPRDGILDVVRRNITV